MAALLSLTVQDGTERMVRQDPNGKDASTSLRIAPTNIASAMAVNRPGTMGEMVYSTKTPPTAKLAVRCEAAKTVTSA